ncbi:hypothetical protein RCL1_008923 [Eukaryota sp. TZLM3-RCL]
MYGAAQIPSLDNENKRFRLLGQQISVAVGKQSKLIIQQHIIKLFNSKFSSIMQCKISANIKLRMIQLALASFVIWHFMVHEVNVSFNQTELMPSYVAHLKKLRGLARSSNTNRLFLPLHKGGLALPDLIHLYHECQLQRTFVLKFSLDPGITKLYELKEAQQLVKSKSWNVHSVAKTLLKRLEDSGKNLSTQ